MQTTNNEAVTLHSAALPDLICTATTAIAPEQIIAALPLGHPWLSLIAPTRARSAGFSPNAKIIPACPDSPGSQCTVTALQPIGPEEMILACPTDDTQSRPSIQIVGQFDGSCQREEMLGGAGYVVYAIEGGQSRVIACRAVALPQCSDNIEAEILACLFLVEEVSVLVKQLLIERGITPKVLIQGDILPVIKYFQFAGRLRRLDMNQPLECIRTTVSLHLPHALFLYLPRVANSIADDLAGQASHFVLAQYRRDPMNFIRDSGPVSIRPDFSAPLFQVGGFHIQCFEQPWVQPVFALVERPSIDHGLLRRHLTLHPHHRQLVESYLSPCVPQCSSIEIGYSPRTADYLGRKYCCTMGGQRMPRAARLLLFGRSHCEVDLEGSFYELVRRLGLRYLPDHMPLPAIDDLRAMLSRDPYIQAVEALRPHTIKQLPLRIINSSIDAAYHYLRSIVDGSPGAILSAVLHQLWSQSKTLTDQLLPRFRPAYSTSQSDSAFRLLEHFEARIVEDTMKALIARHPTQSLVWLHDGFLVAPPPPEHMLRQIEKAVLSRHQLHFDQTWFKITPLAAQYEEYIGNLQNTASAPVLALARRTPLQRIREQHAGRGLAHTCITPLEALAKLRARRERPARITWRVHGPVTPHRSKPLIVHPMVTSNFPPASVQDNLTTFTNILLPHHSLFPRSSLWRRILLPGVPWVVAHVNADQKKWQWHQASLDAPQYAIVILWSRLWTE